jgi:beta-N-acetylhexosaminidase
MLCCSDYETQYPAVLEAVRSGRITVERIEESVTRILRWKIQLKLIKL